MGIFRSGIRSEKECDIDTGRRVRQWFISVLRDVMKVPMHMMMSEVGMKYGEGTVKRSSVPTLWSSTAGRVR